MGAGHSGSTILGVALGNCAGFFYAGEIDEWLVNGGATGLGGEARSDYWDSVRAAMGESAVDLYGGEANRCIERSSAAFRVDRWGMRRRLLARYRRVAEELLVAIATAAGARHVVDTSHFPLRARELRRLASIDLYLVYLVRDPQRVVASNVRGISPRDVAERRLRTLTTNVGLWVTQLLSVFVFLTHPSEQRVFVRHEDFLTDPDAVIARILAVVKSSAPVPDLSALEPGFPFEGNQLIGSERIAIEGPKPPDGRWSLMTALLQLPWAPVLARLRPAAPPGVDSARLRGR